MRALVPAFLQLLLLALPLQQVYAQTQVNVGAYNFPPYVIQAESEDPEGLLIDLLALLNQQQTEFTFVLVPTSVARRYQDMNSGRYDLIFFESADWGWQGVALNSMDMAIEDADIFVAKNQPGRNQDYFDSFSGKRLALHTGYHYAFTGFNADRDALRQHYQAEFSYSHESNLLRVLFGRSDITVVSQSFLDNFIAQNPQSADQFLVSQRKDQVYRFQMLSRPGSPISVDQLHQLCLKLHGNEQLSALLRKYHVQKMD